MDVCSNRGIGVVFCLVIGSELSRLSFFAVIEVIYQNKQIPACLFCFTLQPKAQECLDDEEGCTFLYVCMCGGSDIQLRLAE